ncbi:MAG: hypothetical protein K2Y27_02455 [Xanthobacteraceae bacterium]|nr:hypothetical protein [Xanthobacteraceae bacterium]
MTKMALMAAAGAAVVVLSSQVLSSEAFAKAPAPLVPIALVEDVKSASADVEFMDYVGTGQVIKLAPQDVLVLSYLKSCAHETITGGTVHVGADKSEVEGGKIVRSKVPCNGGNMKLSAQQANASGASSFRLQNASFDPTLYAVTPVVQIPKLRAGEARSLVIERQINGQARPNEHFTVELDESFANGGFYDLAKSNTKLKRGAIYTATLGSRKVMFKVDAKAKTGKTPVVSRLLRFPPG